MANTSKCKNSFLKPSVWWLVHKQTRPGSNLEITSEHMGLQSCLSERCRLRSLLSPSPRLFKMKQSKLSVQHLWNICSLWNQISVIGCNTTVWPGARSCEELLLLLPLLKKTRQASLCGGFLGVYQLTWMPEGFKFCSAFYCCWWCTTRPSSHPQRKGAGRTARKVRGDFSWNFKTNFSASWNTKYMQTINKKDTCFRFSPQIVQTALPWSCWRSKSTTSLSSSICWKSSRRCTQVVLLLLLF